MVPFIDTKEFKELNVGLALDEGFCLVNFYLTSRIKYILLFLGQVSPNENYDIYYAQRMLWCKRKFSSKSNW